MAGQDSRDYLPAGAQGSTAAEPADSRKYLTGANPGSTQNGWDTPFFKSFLDGYNNASDDERKSWFLNKRTGIAMADETGTDQAGQQQTVKFGDVYNDGKLVGNLYDQYDRSQADQIMGQLTLSASEQRQIHDTGTLSSAVANRRSENSRNVQSAASRAEYDTAVQAQKDAQGDESDVGLTLGGAAGGALTGAGLGAALGSVVPVIGTAAGAVVGGVAGGILGATGAYANRDELNEMVARGEVQAQQLDKQGLGAAATAQRLQSWAGVASQEMNPLSNVLHGYADTDGIGWGKQGDDKVAYYDTDANGQPKRNLAWTAADLAAGVTAGVGQMATGVGAAVYGAQMAAQVGGKAGALALSGGQSFDERTGAYDNVFTSSTGELNLASGAAAVGDIGIDVVQMMLPRGLMKGAAAIGRSEGTVLDRLSGARSLLGDSANVRREAGMKFTLDEAGQAIGARPTLALAAPSEMVQYLGARTSALLAHGNNLGKISADDLYQAAQRMTSKARVSSTALLTAFGEGTEEAVQAVLEPLSHQQSIDPMDVLNSFYGGAAMGAGMAIGSRVGTKRQSDRTFAQAQVYAGMLNDTQLSEGNKDARKNWDAMSDAEQATYLAQPKIVVEAARSAAGQLAAENTRKAIESVPALAYFTDTLRNAKAAELARMSEASDQSFVITKADAGIADHMQQGSINTIVKLYENKVSRMMDQLRSPQLKADPAKTQALQAILDRTNAVLATVTKARDDFYNPNTTEDTQARIVASINAQLQSLWKVPPRDGAAPFAGLEDAKAVSVLDLRNPADNKGSFELLLPQVSLENSRRREPGSNQGRGDGVLQLTLGPTEPMGADFDGDKATALTSALLDDETFRSLRMGSNRLGTLPGHNVMLMKSAWEAGELQELRAALQSQNSAARAAAISTLDDISTQVLALMPFAAPEMAIFERSLRSGTEEIAGNAKAAFIQRLYENHLKEIQDLGLASYEDPWFAVNTAIRNALQLHQTMQAEVYAAEIAADGRVKSNNVQVITGKSKIFQTRATSAATNSQTLWQNLAGADLFRKWQALNYTAIRTPEVSRRELTQQEKTIVDEMTAMYLRVSSGMVESKLEELRAKDEVTGRVAAQLEEMLDSAEYGRPGMSRLALIQLAQMRVPNLVESDRGEYFGKSQITMAQWLLRRSVATDQAKFAGQETDELKRKWNRLSKASPAEAFMEVFGQYRASELLGIDGNVFGNRSIDQILARYVNQDDTHRGYDIETLRMHASYLARTSKDGKHNLPFDVSDYSGRNGKGITAFQVFVDTLEDAGNHEIGWDAGKNKLEGRVGELSQRTGTAIVEGLRAMQQAAARDSGFNVKSADAWRTLLDRHPKMADSFIRLIPEDAVFSVIIPATDGTTVRLPEWVYGMLTMAPEQAEMVLLRQSLLASWEQLKSEHAEDGTSLGRNPDTMTDRLHLLMYRLATSRNPFDMARFTTQLAQSKTVDEFVTFLNNDIRGNEAPFTAWNRDLATIDPTSVNGSISAKLPSSQYSSTVSEFRELAKKFSVELDAEAKQLELDDSALSMLEHALTNPSDAANAELIKKVQNRIGLARKFRSALGPAARLRSIAFAVFGNYGNATDKGKAAEGFAVQGPADMARDMPAFGTAEESQLDALTALDLQDVTTNPSWFSQDLTLMDANGHVVELDELTVESLAQYAAVPENRLLLSSFLHPSVWDHVGNDRVAQRFLEAPTLENLLRPEQSTDLLFGDSWKDLDAHASLLEGVEGHQAVQRYVASVLISNTSSRRTVVQLDEVVKQTLQANRDLVKIVRHAAALATTKAIGEVRDAETNELIPDATMLDMVRERMKAERASALLVQRFGATETASAVKLIMGQFKQELREDTADADDAAVAWALQMQEAADQVVETDLLRKLVLAWTLPAATGSDWMERTRVQRSRINEYVLRNGTLLVEAGWSPAVRKVWDPQTRIDPVDDLPELSAEEWHKLSRVVFVHEMTRRTTTSVTNIALSEAPGGKAKTSPSLDMEALKHYDPAFNWMLDDLLSPNSPLVQAELELQRGYGYATGASTEQELNRAIEGSFLDATRNIGTWTDDIPVQIAEMQRRIDASGVPEQIAAGGSGPKNYDTEVTATLRGWDLVPGADLQSTATIDLAMLKRNDPLEQVLVKRPGGEEPASALLLDGRFASRVVVTVDGTEVDLLRETPSAGFLFTGNQAAIDSGLYGITRKGLTMALQAYAQQHHLNAYTLPITVEFFHPADQPADPQWANSGYFEGLTGDGDVDMPSLISSWLFIAGGMDPETSAHSLTANKKGTAAHRNPLRITRAERRAAEAGWQSDYYGMLRTKALLMLQPNRLGEGETISPLFYNAIVKSLKLRHAVRGVDVDGKTVLISSEEMLDAQKRGVDIAAERGLQDLELVPISARALRTMLGEQGTRGLNRAFADDTPGITQDQVLPWTGRFTELHTARLRGLTDGVEKTLFDTEATQRNALVQLSPLAGVDLATANKFRQNMTFFKQLQKQVRDLRQQEKRPEIFNATVEHAFQTARAGATPSATNQALLEQGLPSRGYNDELDRKSLDIATRHLQEYSERTGDVIGNVYHHVAPDNAATTLGNLYGEKSLKNAGKPSAYWLAPGDPVTVDLDSFAQREKDLPRVLHRMMDMGLTILLPDEQSSLKSAAKSYLADNGYGRMNGTESIYEPVDPTDTPVTVRARYSKLAETAAIDTSRYVMVYQSRLGGNEENSAWWLDPAFGQNVLLGVNLIPTQLHGQFNLPTPEQMVQLKARIQHGASELAAMTEAQMPKGWSNAQRDAALDKLTESIVKVDLMTSEGLYPRGTKLVKGDLIPLYDQDNDALLLYRHGYKAPRPAELRAMFAAHANTAIYAPEEDSGKTAYEGEVRRFIPTSQQGLRVELNVPLQQIAGKLVFDHSGFKIVPTAVPESLGLNFPEGIPGVPISAVIGISDSVSKANYWNRIDNFGNAITFLGADFSVDVAKFMLGDTSPDSLRQVEMLLKRMREILPKYNIETVDMLMKMDSLDQVLVNELNQLPLFDAKDQDLVQRLAAPDLSPEGRILRGMMLYLMYEHSDVNHILSSSGVSSDRQNASGVSFSTKMPTLFTQIFDGAPADAPLRKHMMEKLQERFSNSQVAADGRRLGMVLRPDFQVEVVTANGKHTSKGYLQFVDVSAAGTNPVLDLLSAERTDSQKLSEQQSAMAYASIGATMPTSKQLKKTSALAGRTGMTGLETVDDIFKVLRDVDRETSMPRGLEYTFAEREYVLSARLAMEGFRQALDTSRWTKEQRNEFTAERGRLASRLGLDRVKPELIDYWIRQHAGRPTEKADETKGQIGFDQAMEYLGRIEKNRADGLVPTANAAVPLLHAIDLRALYEGSQANGRFELYSAIGDPSTKVASWQEWMHVALGIGSIDNEFFDAAFLTPTDGMLHTYANSGVRFVGLPISADPLRAQQLVDPATSEMLLSISARRRAQLANPELVAVEGSLHDIFGGQRTGLSWNGDYPPASAISERSSRLWAWRKENKIPHTMEATYKNFLRYGANYVDDGNRQSAPLRIMTNLRAALALLNPMMYVGAPIEAWAQTTLEDAANALVGNGTGRFLGAAKYSPEELRFFAKTDTALGENQKLKGMIYSEIALDQNLYNAGRVELATSWWARFAGRWQDPYYGMKARAVAKRYRESVTRVFLDSGMTNFTAESIAQHLLENPTWVREEHPAVHKMAMNTIREIRNVKATTMSLAWRGIVEPLSSSTRLIVSWPSTLFLKMPFMFASYGFNKAVQILGLQGVDAALAAFLHGRKKGPINGIGRLLAAVSGTTYEAADETFDMSDVMENVDLTTAFVKSGLTHTGLLTLGMMLGGLNLSGEDDEDRRRRRAAKYKGFAYLYDPRSLVNDFRNADSIFLDNIPVLNALFKVPGSEHSIASMNWITKQVVSPLLGMERFFDTGNPYEILWGFESAIGSMPLINSMQWDSAANTFAELMSSSMAEDAKGDPNSLPVSFNYLLLGVSSLERMLLESSFANMLYVGMDKYDRDPWVQVDYTSTDEQRTNRLGIPQKTGALREFVGADGTVQQGYVGRDWYDAQVHALTENRGTLALLTNIASFMTGGHADYLRQDMAVKTRVIDKTGIDLLDAEAVVNSLAHGATPEQLHLEGFYLTFEIRQQLEAKLKADLIAEGKKLKLSDYKAEQRMWQIWNGSSTNPSVPGLKDIVWSTGNFAGTISYKQSTQYRQLNTTYVMGPDGRPWATGISRNLLVTALGFAPLQGYNVGTVGGMNVDGRLNSVDDGRDINTGLRALEKIDSESETPVDEQQPKTTQAANSYTPNQFGYGGYGGYGGGGGGGYSSSFRLQAPDGHRVPYADDIPNLNLDSTIIRRASIRRERTSNEKGRLKPWQ